LGRFELWLRVRDCGDAAVILERGLPELTRLAVNYLRGAFATMELSTSQVGHLISAIRRLVLVAEALGAVIPDHPVHLRTLWRIHRAWQLAVPSEFRTPVSYKSCLAIAITLWLQGRWGVALLTLLGWHCLLRPSEARMLRWSDILTFGPEDRHRYEGVYGIIRIEDPKTRRVIGHATHQHVLLECLGLATLLRACRAAMATSPPDARIWAGADHEYFRIFVGVARDLGLASLHLTPGGLRGGGATDHWLRRRDVQALRRRGRWTNVKTLERYVQEGASQLQQQQSLPNAAAARLDSLAALAPAFFTEAAAAYGPGQV